MDESQIVHLAGLAKDSPLRGKATGIESEFIMLRRVSKRVAKTYEMI